MKKISITIILFIAILIFAMPVLSVANSVERDTDGSPLPHNVKYKTFVHYPEANRGGRTTAPACTITTNDQISDFGNAGWYLGESKIYNLNETTIPANLDKNSVYSALQTAWTAWSTADANIVANAGLPVLLTQPKYDATNLVAWGRVPNNAIAVTYTWYNSVTGKQLESDMIFNKKLKWSYTPYSADCAGVAGTYDFGDITTHELGHWVGLNDLYGSSQKDLTMYGYGFMAELKKDTLGLGDILGAAAITP